MKVIEIDQRDIQRKGSSCVRYPSSYIIFLLMEEARKKLGVRRLRVVDLTYGEGKFHVVPRQHDIEEFLVGVDVQILDWVIKPDAFIPKPLQKRETLELLRKLGPFDVLIIDPPFHTGKVRGREKRPHYYAAFGRPKFLLEEGYRVAAALEIPFVVAHFNKTRFDTAGYKHIIEVRFRPVVRIVTERTTYFWLSILPHHHD